MTPVELAGRLRTLARERPTDIWRVLHVLAAEVQYDADLATALPRAAAPQPCASQPEAELDPGAHHDDRRRHRGPHPRDPAGPAPAQVVAAMTRHTNAPRPPQSRGLRLTITFEFAGHIAVEAGQRLATRWMAEQTDLDDGIRVVRVHGADTPALPTAGHIVRRRRERLGLTQQQLGKLAGVTDVTVSHIETGKRSGPAYPAVLAALKRAEASR